MKQCRMWGYRWRRQAAQALSCLNMRLDYCTCRRERGLESCHGPSLRIAIELSASRFRAHLSTYFSIFPLKRYKPFRQPSGSFRPPNIDGGQGRYRKIVLFAALDTDVAREEHQRTLPALRRRVSTGGWHFRTMSQRVFAPHFGNRAGTSP